MADAWEAVSASALEDGDEVEVTFTGVYAKEAWGFIPFMGARPAPWLQSVRRKVRAMAEPIKIGDTIKHPRGGEAVVLAIEGDMAFVRTLEAGERCEWSVVYLPHVRR